jgi:hypothetical protein
MVTSVAKVTNTDVLRWTMKSRHIRIQLIARDLEGTHSYRITPTDENRSLGGFINWNYLTEQFYAHKIIIEEA